MKRAALLVALLALLTHLGAARAEEPTVAGPVFVNGKRLSTPFYRSGRHLWYPLLDIAEALRRPVGGTRDARVIGGRPFVSWPTLQHHFPDLAYGVRGDQAFFETRKLAAAPVARPSPSPSPSQPSAQSALEQEIVAELSLARTDPQRYATFVEEERGRIHGNLLASPDGREWALQEGVAPYDEAITFLRAQRPLGPLQTSAGLARAARDHVQDQGPKGATGHDGSDGSHIADRASRYGTWQRMVGENISYGPDTARTIVLQLIVDDGVPNRGHRTNIFQPAFKVVGVACGPHTTYGIMCVMDFAGGFTP